jgi:probable DNA metabolism protein
MYLVRMREPDCLAEFRDTARRLIAASIEPAAIVWQENNESSLLAESIPECGPDQPSAPSLVPRAFLLIAQTVICHRAPQRLSLLYQALWRIVQGEKHLLDVPSDALTLRLRRMASAVQHDQHRMTAFLRFRVIRDHGGDYCVAWYEPQHRILRRTASFFIDRFARLRFSILTPDLTLHWDGVANSFGPGMNRQDAPPIDHVEAWWQRYYSATFNPARVNERLLASHMPKRFWRNLPEAAAIPRLLSDAKSRTKRMIAQPGTGTEAE